MSQAFEWIAMSRLARALSSVLERVASTARSGEYRLDASVPLSALVSVTRRRIAGLVRAAVRGRCTSLHPRGWSYFGPGVQFRNRRYIHIDPGVTLGKGVIIDGLSHGGVHLGRGVTVGSYTIIEASGVITDIGTGFWIGERSAIGSFSFVGAAGGVWIGRDVIMGNRVSFHSENHNFADRGRPIREQGVTRHGIRLEDDCWIGANATFLDGAHVGRGCVIGAGSVVRGEIPPFSIAVGVPARVVSTRLEQDSR